MNKALLALRNEIAMTVKRRSFLLVALGVPSAMIVVTLIVSLLNRPQAAPAPASARPQTAQVEGYVDHSGIIARLPADVPADRLGRYADEQAANQALAQGEIEAYYVVPADYLATGKLVYVHPQANLTTRPTTVGVMQWTLLVNMLGGDMERAARVWSPMQITATALRPETARAGAEGLSMLPYLVVLVFYVVVIMSGSLLRNSMGEERKNRVQEILLTSVDPLHLLIGKIAALGIVGLGQTLLWAAIGYAAMRVMGSANILPAGLQLPVSLIAWTAVFFVLGYAVYGSLLAGLGALAGPNAAGSSSADVVVLWPTLIPLVLWAPIVDDPNGVLAVVLSLFPLTSPVAVILRMVVGPVPVWQLALAIALQIVTAALVVRGVASAFRAQNLLTGQPFSMKSYIAMMLGRA